MQDTLKLIQLRELIIKHYNLSDLADLCLYLNIDFEELGQGRKSEIVRELLLYMERYNRFSVLLKALAIMRPHVDWSIINELSPDLLAFEPFQRHDTYQHTNLPPHYVPRPELLADLRQTLLGNVESLALTSAMPMNALHGMGGIGKSVMARALCDDPEVQATFPDGILWADVGQQPDLISCLDDWVRRLGGNVTQTAPTVDQLKVTLADLLQERACLLIADDVWRHKHATVFQVGGPRCCLLITTRNAAVARKLGAVIQSVSQMSSDEAIQLLQQWAQGKLATTDERLLQTIVARVEHLPLAVRLAGAQLFLREPTAWLATFDVLRLREQQIETVHDSLALTFSLSLNDLNQESRRLYMALSIFKEDEAIPVASISKLWRELAGSREDETMYQLADLAERALLEWQPPNQLRAIRLHDLLQEMMVKELGKDKQQATHRALLAAYRKTQVSLSWANVQDDGYLYAHLVYHLNELADADEQTAAELQSLFADDAWLNARVSADNYQYHGYLADLRLVWQQAHNQTEQQIEIFQPPVSLADCIHYALIHTTVNSMAASYVPALVARAVQVGFWHPRRALSLTQRIPNIEARANMYITILTLCQKQLDLEQTVLMQTELLQVMEQIMDEGVRAEVLGQLAPHLSGNLVNQALKVAERIEDEKYRATALGELVPYLSKEVREYVLAEALQVAERIEDEKYRATALGELVPYLSKEVREYVLTEALQAAERIEDKEYRATALGKLVPYLGKKKVREITLNQALKAAEQIENEWSRVAVLGELTVHLSDDAQETILNRALQIAEQIEPEWVRAAALGELAVYLNEKAQETILNQALEMARRIKEEWIRAEVLGLLASQLSGKAQETALAEVLQIVDRVTTKGGILDVEIRTEVLEQLAPHISGDLLIQALQIVERVTDEWMWAKTLGRLILQLNGKTKEAILTRALRGIEQIANEEIKVSILGQLAPHLNEDLLIKALHITEQIADEEIKVSILGQLAPYLSDEARENALSQVLQAVERIEDAWKLTKILEQLAPQLSGNLLTEALHMIERISVSEWSAESLGQLVFQLSREMRENDLAEILQAVGQVEDAWKRAKTLGQLVPHLSGEALEITLSQALQAAERIEDVEKQVVTLGQLVPYLSGEALEITLNQALQAVEQIEDMEKRAVTLGQLAPHLSDEVQKITLNQALQAVERIEDVRKRATTLGQLVPYLSENLLVKALQITERMADEESQAMIIRWLVPQLRGDLLVQALQLAIQVKDERSWTMILEKLASQLSGEAQEMTLNQALQAAERVNNKEWQAILLGRLSLQLSGEAQEAALIQALQAVEQIQNEWSRAMILKQLVPHLNKDRLTQKFQDIVLKTIWDFRTKERKDLLGFLEEGLLTADSLALSPVFFATIAQSIIEICQEWHWL